MQRSIAISSMGEQSLGVSLKHSLHGRCRSMTKGCDIMHRQHASIVRHLERLWGSIDQPINDGTVSTRSNGDMHRRCASHVFHQRRVSTATRIQQQAKGTLGTGAGGIVFARVGRKVPALGQRHRTANQHVQGRIALAVLHLDGPGRSPEQRLQHRRVDPPTTAAAVICSCITTTPGHTLQVGHMQVQRSIAILIPGGDHPANLSTTAGQ
mmetsp:Transcript_10251/g.22199  ORF Transcript_10251/g.22199 Transcript_10251/m.22199 type:complete len:210 (+) Transcript_10251:1164-1793(+)